MEIIYRAQDGKEFDDEYKCADYERGLRVHTFKMWDDECKPITDYDYDNYGKVTYVRVKDSTEIDDVRKEFNYYGYSRAGIDTPGLYHYSEEGNWAHWENVDDLIKSYNEFIQELARKLTIMR